MSSSSELSGKISAYGELKASPTMFHDLMFNRPHHISNACPAKIQACDLHHGDYGKHGSIVCWSYVHEGKPKTAKNLVTLDPKTKAISHRVLEGDLMDEYKTFVVIIEPVPAPKGGGAIVHWTIEYEKLNANVPAPQSMLDFLIGVCKDMGSHLVKP